MDYRYEGGNDGLEHEDMHQDPSCDLLSCSSFALRQAQGEEAQDEE